VSRIRNVSFSPNPLVAGKQVQVTLEVDDPAAIASAKVYDPRGYELAMSPAEEGDTTVFRLSELVPYDADAGTYYATVVLKDTQGTVERKSVEIRVA